MKLVNNKIIKIIWKIIKSLFTFFLTLVILIIVIQRIFNNNVSLLGYRIFTVASGSMEPKYKILDMLLVKTIDSKEIKVKDDIVYRGLKETYKDKIITHQVIKIEQENNKISFHTKGIANPLEDPIVNEEQVLGKAIYKFKALSFLNRIINNIIGFFILIVIPITVLIFLEILDIKGKREKLENDRQ